MRTLRFWPIGIMIALCLPLSIEAQNYRYQARYGLTLRGTIQSITVEPKGSDPDIRVELRFELSNTGQIPIIFWKHDENDHLGGLYNKPYMDIGYDLSGTPEFNRRHLIASHRAGPSWEYSRVWGKMHKALNQKTPPPGKTALLLPNQTRSFDYEVVILCSEKRYGALDPPTLRELEEAGAFWLRAYFEVWSFNLEGPLYNGDMKFGRKLQLRWEKYGRLWLDDLYSEPIKIELKQTAYKKAAS